MVGGVATWGETLGVGEGRGLKVWVLGMTFRSLNKLRSTDDAVPAMEMVPSNREGPR